MQNIIPLIVTFIFFIIFPLIGLYNSYVRYKKKYKCTFTRYIVELAKVFWKAHITKYFFYCIACLALIRFGIVDLDGWEWFIAIVGFIALHLTLNPEKREELCKNYLFTLLFIILMSLMFFPFTLLLIPIALLLFGLLLCF